MLGDKIRDLRVHRNLTQAELADRSGVSRPWLSRVEAGAIFKPDLRKIGAIAKVLDADPEEWFRLAGYVRRDPDKPSPEDMTIDEIMSLMNRLADQLRKRTEPIRLDDRRDGTDPSVRRSARTQIGDLQAVR